MFHPSWKGYDDGVDALPTLPNLRVSQPRRVNRSAAGCEPGFSFAFQPIVDVRNREIVSYEALLRGPHGEPSGSVLSRVLPADFPRFDAACHCRAIALVARLHLTGRLNLNLVTCNSEHLEPVMRGITLACQEYCFPVENIIIELAEPGNKTGQVELLQALRIVQELGFSTAIDDFGSGYSGLQLLVDHQPHYIKVDRRLIGGIQQDVVRQRIFLGFWRICNSLAIHIIAGGVEQAGEYQWLQEAGVRFFQGDYFARPSFEKLPEVPGRVFCV